MSGGEVDGWFAGYDNPQKDLMQAVRRTILAADPRIGETVKWQAPTFTYKGNIASFFPKARAHVSLMFHKGALIPGQFAGLEGEGPEARTFKVASAAELDARAGELAAIVRAWCDWRDGP